MDTRTKKGLFFPNKNIRNNHLCRARGVTLLSYPHMRFTSRAKYTVRLQKLNTVFNETKCSILVICEDMNLLPVNGNLISFRLS